MRDYKFLISIIISIILLSAITYWQFKSFHKALPEIGFPKFEMPTLELFLPKQDGESKEFISPNGKLIFKYPPDWIELGNENLKNINQEIFREESEILFFAQKFKIETGSFAFLLIQELGLERGNSLEEIIETMKEEARKKDREIEIIEITPGDKEAYFEAIYKREGTSSFYSKEKLIFTQDKNYLITFITLDRDWRDFEKEADKILNAAQLIF